MIFLAELAFKSDRLLGGLLRAKNAVPGLTDNILSRFTQSFNNREDEAVRSRIVRTCLIPLATMCLSRLGEGSVQFSAQQAGVNQNNWKEFLDFIRTPENAIPFTQSCFSFHSTEIKGLHGNLWVNQREIHQNPSSVKRQSGITAPVGRFYSVCRLTAART